MKREKKKLATIIDVAKQSGVSVGTVSNVINGTAKVSEKTRHKVNAAIESLDFRPNDMARGLRSSGSKLIGFLAPDINEFYTSVAKGFVERAYKDGYTVLYTGAGYSKKRERELIELLLQKRAEAIVLIGGDFDEEYLNKIHQEGARLLLLDGHLKDSQIPSVEFDNFAVMKELITHLKKSGYKRIGFVSETIGMTNLKDRFRGYQSGIEENGMQLNENDIYISEKLQMNKKKESYEWMKRLLEQKPRSELPDVFVATSDYVAVGVLDAIKEYGYAVPDDIGVTGFDNSVITEYLSPPLTTIEQDVAAMGEIAWKMAKALILGEPPDSSAVLLPQKIVLRGTTRKSI